MQDVCASLTPSSSWYYGYHLSELNYPAESLTCLPRAHLPPSKLPLCIGIDSDKYGFVTAIYTVGGLVGSLISSWMVEHHGVKGGLTWTAYLNLFGAIVMTMATRWWILAFGRYVEVDSSLHRSDLAACLRECLPA
jgi:SP family facilitated glucose transporter-like MFS transporter 3